MTVATPQKTSAARAGELEIPFARPDVGAAEQAAVAQALASGWLTTGPRAERFERELAAVVGARWGVATSSCTAALQLALASLDAEPGAAVLVPTYNFAAAAEVVQHRGLFPALVDSEPRTLNLDPESARAVVHALRRAGREVCAVVPVHLGGHPCDTAAVDALAAEHGLAVIEDAAHALPAARDGVAVGRRRASGQPRAVCYSFYANKTLTTGEGGLLVCDDAALAARCRRLGQHGIDRGLWAREHGEGLNPALYEIEEAGYKANLSDLAAAIGLVQLAKLEAMRARRAAVASRYDAAFAGHPALEVPTVETGVESAWHLYLLRLRLERCARPEGARDRLAAWLRARGIGTSVHYRPLHLHRHYRETLGYAPGSFPVASREWLRVVSLPIYPGLTDEEVARVIAAVEEGVDGL